MFSQVGHAATSQPAQTTYCDVTIPANELHEQARTPPTARNNARSYSRFVTITTYHTTNPIGNCAGLLALVDNAGGLAMATSRLRAPASFTTSPFLLLLAFIPPLASGRTALVLGFSSPTGLAPTPLFVTRRALAVVRPSATGVVSPASSGPSGADSGQFAASVVYQCTSSLFIPPGRPIRTEHHQHPHRPRKTPCTSPPRFCYCLSFSSHPSLLHTHITADFFPTRGAHHRARRALSLRAQRSSSRARPKSPSRASPSGPTRTPTSTRKSFSRCTSTAPCAATPA